MKVRVRYIETSQPVYEEEGVFNTYTKGPLYCVFDETKETVKKFPIEKIFDIQESYS